MYNLLESKLKSEFHLKSFFTAFSKIFPALHANVWLLMFVQSLTGTIGPVIVFVGGFIGLSLAPNQILATLPVACMIVGTAGFMLPVVKLLEVVGRKYGFIICVCWGVINTLLTAYAVTISNFWLFCFSVLLFGVLIAAGQQFRFAAMESVDDHKAGQAVSVLMVAGLFAAFIGPEVAFVGKDLFAEPFVGSFVGLSLILLTSLAFLAFYRPIEKQQAEVKAEGRPLINIAKQPVFIAAIASATAGFSIMSFIMTATPISMHVQSGFDMVDTKWVIQSHIIAMFLPSFVTGKLISKFGHAKMLFAGIIIFVGCIFIGFAGRHYVHYWWALVLLGIGWNFMFVTATALLPQSYTESEKYRVQGFNDVVIFSCQALASLSAGWVIKSFGWNTLLMVCLPLLIATAICVWFWQTQQSVPAGQSSN